MAVFDRCVADCLVRTQASACLENRNHLAHTGLSVEDHTVRDVGDFSGFRRRGDGVTGMDFAVDALGVAVVEEIALAAAEGCCCEGGRNQCYMPKGFVGLFLSE